MSSLIEILKMSEYQYLTFRALDGPLTEEAMAFMRNQSTRAKIDQWSFTNEYHFGDFRGDAVEMMRRGFDMHFHYADFGTRTLMIRLPFGFPDPISASHYWHEEGLFFHKDEEGSGGVLEFAPCFEPGLLDGVWDLEEIFESLFDIRKELLEGDPRPLYLMHLAIQGDSNHDPEESIEGPVPAGMNHLTRAQRALAKLYGMDSQFLAAVAEPSLELCPKQDRDTNYSQWLQEKSAEEKNQWLLELMINPQGRLANKILNQFRQETEIPGWPKVSHDRTYAAIEELAKVYRQQMRNAIEKTAQQERQQRLDEMVKDLEAILLWTEEVVTARDSKEYSRVAQALSDLREAFAGTDQVQLADVQAWKLMKENPRLSRLKRELKQKGFLK